MNVVVLHVIRTEASADYGELRLARPALAPEDRVLLWEGMAPGPAPDHASLAAVAFRGDLSGRGAYGEAIPRGLRWSSAPPPPSLRPYAVCQVLGALAELHGAHQVHGAVSPGRIWLGQGGEVVLVGRGRSSAMARLDVLGAMALLTGTDDTLPSEDPRSLRDDLCARCSPTDREQLAAWVRAHAAPEPHEPVEQLLVTLADLPDQGADEILPDIGSDTGGDGLLDRWVAITGGTPGENTAEVTDGGAASQSSALALWSRLASLPSGPPDRFDALAGQPSRGIRRLLERAPPEPLPVLPTGGPGLLLPAADTSPPESEDTAVLPALATPWSTPELVLAAATLAAVVWGLLWLLSTW